MGKKCLNEKNKGITLIALVITIIILLILAGVTISMLTGENGILKRAREAKEKMEIATEEEQNTLLQYEYEIAKMQGEISETETFGEYSMEKKIKEKYGQDIKIGDTVRYDASISDYSGTWKVLGIENGQILLMSSKPVSSAFKLKGREGFRNIEEKLDAECTKYGAGDGAESARSLRVEDINKITGYNPENPEKIEKYQKGTIAEYGEKVTFTLNDGQMECKCSNGQSITKALTSFEHVDGRKIEGTGEITIVNGSYRYEYEINNYVNGYIPSDGMKSLFWEVSPELKPVHLASTNSVANVGNDEFAAYFQEFYIKYQTNNFALESWRLFTSDGVETEREGNVVAVVTLKPDIALVKGVNDDWDLGE